MEGENVENTHEGGEPSSKVIKGKINSLSYDGKPFGVISAEYKVEVNKEHLDWMVGTLIEEMNNDSAFFTKDWGLKATSFVNASAVPYNIKNNKEFPVLFKQVYQAKFDELDLESFNLSIRDFKNNKENPNRKDCFFSGKCNFFNPPREFYYSVKIASPTDDDLSHEIGIFDINDDDLSHEIRIFDKNEKDEPRYKLNNKESRLFLAKYGLIFELLAKAAELQVKGKEEYDKREFKSQKAEIPVSTKNLRKQLGDKLTNKRFYPL